MSAKKERIHTNSNVIATPFSLCSRHKHTYYVRSVALYRIRVSIGGNAFSKPIIVYHFRSHSRLVSSTCSIFIRYMCRLFSPPFALWSHKTANQYNNNSIEYRCIYWPLTHSLRSLKLATIGRTPTKIMNIPPKQKKGKKRKIKTTQINLEHTHTHTQWRTIMIICSRSRPKLFVYFLTHIPMYTIYFQAKPNYSNKIAYEAEWKYFRFRVIPCSKIDGNKIRKFCVWELLLVLVRVVGCLLLLLADIFCV